MRLIPAIDVLNGKVVRLHQGDYAESTVYANTPLQQLREYEQSGASLIHVVDLDAAKKGKFVNRTVFQELIDRSQVDLQLAGGVRDAYGIKERFKFGIKRVVVGSMVVTATEEFCSWLKLFGPDKLVAAVDVQMTKGEYIPRVHGWTQAADVALFTLLDRIVDKGLKHLLCTDISRDGMLSGPNFELYAEILRRYPGIQLQASGGVSSMHDLEKLALANLPEVISGKALLDGRIDMYQALQRYSI